MVVATALVLQGRCVGCWDTVVVAVGTLNKTSMITFIKVKHENGRTNGH